MAEATGVLGRGLARELAAIADAMRDDRRELAYDLRERTLVAR